MTKKIHGIVSADQSLTGNMQYYTVYMQSPLAFSDPSANPPEDESLIRQLNVMMTDNLDDQSQMNFELLFQSIGLRAWPVVFNNTRAVEELSVEGAPTLEGEGFVWKFACEMADAFMDYSNMNPVGLLVKELDGIILYSGARINTYDSPFNDKNIEFTVTSEL